MSSRLEIDGRNELKELRIPPAPQPPAIRWAATVLSYVFHPVFIPVYVCWFLVAVSPMMFASFSPADKMITILRFFVMYSFFPLVTVLLLKGLGFLDSIQLKTQKDRIVPYIACGIYYFWMWYVLRNQTEFAHEVVIFAMAVWIASSLALMANIYMKVSMHAISVGVMLAFIILLGTRQGDGFAIYMSVAILITGLVCTARLLVSDHTQKEIYGGLIVGILSLVIANWAA